MPMVNGQWVQCYVHGLGGMHLADNGQWVSLDEVKHMIADKNRLREEYEQTVKQLNTAYAELDRIRKRGNYD